MGRFTCNSGTLSCRLPWESARLRDQSVEHPQTGRRDRAEHEGIGIAVQRDAQMIAQPGKQ